MIRSPLQKTILYHGTNDVFFGRLSLACSDFDVELIRRHGTDREITGDDGSFPDIVIVDAEEQVQSGFDVFESMRRKSHFIPVIMTGRDESSLILRAFRSGAADFLPETLDSASIGKQLIALFGRLHVHKNTAEAAGTPLFEKLEQENRELRALLNVTSSFVLSGNSKKALLNNLTDVAAESMNCEAASIMLVNERKSELEFIVATGEKKNRLETMTVPIGEGIAGWVALNGMPQIVNDTSKDSRFTGKIDEESGFITRQILAAPLIIENRIIGVLEVINTRDNRQFSNEDVRMLVDIGERAAIAIEATRTIEDQQNYYGQTTNIIVKAIERKDMFSIGHPWQVAELCHKMGVAMNLSETEISDLHFGALLHDIGKLEMPSSLFNKRELSERELEFIRQHPVKGAKLIEPIVLWKGIVPYILYHHESWDGSGYPFGRQGISIPLCARIINLAESYSVMRSPHSYKRRMSVKESVLEVMRMAGKQFDPDVVKVFIGVLEKEAVLK